MIKRQIIFPALKLLCGWDIMLMTDLGDICLFTGATYYLLCIHGIVDYCFNLVIWCEIKQRCIIFFQSVELRSIKIKVDSKEESLAFRLIHINDIHAHFDQVNEHTGRCKAEDAASNSCFGGIARVKTAVDGIRNAKPDMESIFLNAGDYYQVYL